jgi:peptidoglycan/xylan/chitin deacetylase (PgdA/CDA1 family)
VQDSLGTHHPYFETNISLGTFRRHLRFMAEFGYRTIRLDQVVRGITDFEEAEKSFCITFDDGYSDFYTNAFPALLEFNFQATVFIVAGLTKATRIRAGLKEFMTWDEVREVHAHGMQIGSHTVSHPELYTMTAPAIEQELRNSKREIEEHLGSGVDSFAYPFAFPEQDKRFIRMLRSLLQNHGYTNGVSTIIGTAQPGDDPFFLPRIPLNSYDDLPFLEAKVNGAYDWMHSVQYAHKCVKRII